MPGGHPGQSSALRSKTLLGIAPTLAKVSAPPPPAVATEPDAPGELAPAAPKAAPLGSQNPLRSQTLIGMATPPAPATELVAAASLPLSVDASLASTAATESAPASSMSEQPEAPEKRSGVAILLLAAAGLVIGIGGYRWLHRGVHAPPPDLAALPAPQVQPTPAAASPSAVAADTAPSEPPAASAVAADFPVAPPPPLDPTPDAPSASEPAPPASGSIAEGPSPGTYRITLTTKPPKGKFFHFGKQVGTSPFVVDLPAGEARSYEVWLPGHITRKVRIDGSKSEITLGLREEHPSK